MARQIEKIILSSVPETQVLITDVGITTNAKGGGGIGGGGNSGSHAGNIQVGLCLQKTGSGQCLKLPRMFGVN